MAVTPSDRVDRRIPKHSWISDNLASCCEATPMNKSESLKRAAECTRLAGTTSDPEMQAYLLKLGLSWMQVAAEPDERLPKRADG